jgi:hypothetical protein
MRPLLFLKFQAPVTQLHGAKFQKNSDFMILLFVNSDKTGFQGSVCHSDTLFVNTILTHLYHKGNAVTDFL